MTAEEVVRDYVQSFEDAYDTDDWSVLTHCFAPDVVHDTGLGGEIAGRESVIEYLRGSVEAFDRQFDSRKPTFGEVTVRGNRVSVPWTFTYTRKGAEDLVTSGVEILEVSGTVIERLDSVFDAGVAEKTRKWLATYGDPTQP